MKNKQIIKELKDKLIKEKKQIETSLKGFADPDPKLKGNFDTRFPDFIDRNPEQSENADEVEEYANKLPVEHRLELRLHDINEALERIKSGTYGTCKNCNKEILLERLQANPAAKTCLKCAS